METKYQTSFIPKKPVMTAETSSSSGMSIFLILSIMVFLFTLGLAGYVYLKKQFLINNIEQAKAIIETNRQGIISDSITVEKLVELDSRIEEAKKLLDKHVSVSVIFDFLQKSTLRNVRFKNFSFSSSGKNSNGLSGVTLQMSGQAKDWETVALQADEFGSESWKNFITEPKISNLGLNPDGSVSFLFTSDIVANSLIYKAN